ncbi:hypothetical protein [Micromonospora cathayae]|uniref:Poly A polymerase head domain-containing protein n=1 Tax=Micromonospora cathayae TaxID=3028804 RepID=A0ABY7ZW94_9ACTN|nr:hypothetical protein [Micromonospora sp. HUAS 3]WDZ87265.1 hypothetical protein PVK37_13070 [Micromonospora sp. HUAS 3]
MRGRSPAAPIVTGDLVGGREVAGFAYAEDPVPPTRDNDRLLFDGDQGTTDVPETIVPTDAREAELRGVAPLDRLPQQSRLPADDVSPGLTNRVEAMLGRSDAPWRAIARPLIEALYETGHDVWLAGGAVRDLVLGAGPAAVRDLDLSGTVPPGRFHEIAYDVLALLGGTESDMRLSPDSLVCWTEPEKPQLAETALVEYRSLALSGFPFPGTSSDFGDDARHRDLTVNSLHYDLRRAIVIDPTGRGIGDLIGPVRRIFCCRASLEPRETAAVVLRAIKFALRWEGEGVTVELGELREWADRLPSGHWSGLDPFVWRGIRDDHREYLKHTPTDRQLQVARLIGPAPARLIGDLLEVRS